MAEGRTQQNKKQKRKKEWNLQEKGAGGKLFKRKSKNGKAAVEEVKRETIMSGGVKEKENGQGKKGLKREESQEYYIMNGKGRRMKGRVR